MPKIYGQQLMQKTYQNKYYENITQDKCKVFKKMKFMFANKMPTNFA